LLFSPKSSICDVRIPSSCKIEVNVDVPGSRFETGPWRVDVVRCFDGNLRTFLDGPDAERIDPTDADQVASLVQYFATGYCPAKYRRVPQGPSSLTDLWSRTITAIKLLSSLFAVFGASARPEALELCPDSILYDCKGASVMEGMTKIDVAALRSFVRDAAYDFFSLGCDALVARGPDGTVSAFEDHVDRVLHPDASFAHQDYPRAHASDPFVPSWIKQLAEAMETVGGVAPEDSRWSLLAKHAARDQLFLLSRYVCLRLGLVFSTNGAERLSVAEKVSRLHSGGDAGGPPTSALEAHCRQSRDGWLLIAHEDLEIDCFEAPKRAFAAILMQNAVLSGSFERLSRTLCMASPLRVNQDEATWNSLAAFDDVRVAEAGSMLARIWGEIQAPMSGAPQQATNADQTPLL
jgi:hypothetical protein